MLFGLSVLLAIAAMAVMAIHIRRPRPDKRGQLFLVAMLLLAGSNLTQTFSAFVRAEDQRATAVERLRTPGLPAVVETGAERDLLTQPSLGVLVNAVLGGMLLGAVGTALARSFRPE
jgi:hypothetical protein